MAELTFDLGAKLDIATGDEIVDKMKNDEFFNNHKPLPVYSSRAASGVIPTGNAELFLDLGSPPVGRIWNVTGIVVCGADDHTPLANCAVAIYCGDPQVPSLTSLKMVNLPVPYSSTMSDEVLWCHSKENIVAGISGTATALAQVFVIAHITEWVEKEITAWNGK